MECIFEPGGVLDNCGMLRLLGRRVEAPWTLDDVCSKKQARFAEGGWLLNCTPGRVIG